MKKLPTRKGGSKAGFLVTISGEPDFRPLPPALLKAISTFYTTDGIEIIKIAQSLCPVDQGDLRASGHVEKPRLTLNGGVEVGIGFGGPAGIGNVQGSNGIYVGYAYAVENDMAMFHADGQAKFLSTAWEEWMRDADVRFLAVVNAVMK